MRPRVVLAVVLGMFAAACSRSADVVPRDTAHAVSQSTPRGVEASPSALANSSRQSDPNPDARRGELAPAATADKPVAPISLDVALDAGPRIGAPLHVTVTVRSRVPLTAVRLQAIGGPALTVTAAGAEQSAATATGAAPAVFTITVIPQASGLAHLKLTASGMNAGRRQARSITFPIRIAAPPGTKPSAQTKQTSQGDGLIHLHSD